MRGPVRENPSARKGRAFFSWHQNENHAAVHGGTLGRLTALEEEFDVGDLKGRI